MRQRTKILLSNWIQTNGILAEKLLCYRHSKSWGWAELRAEISKDECRSLDMSWDEKIIEDLRRAEMSQGEVSQDQMRWDEMSRDELRETTSTCSFWRRSLRTLRFHSLNLTCSLWRDLDLARKYCFFHNFNLQFFDEDLAQKLHSHNLNLQSLKQISYKSFVFTTSTSTRSLWRRSCMERLLSQLQCAVVDEDLARKLRFHNFNLQEMWREKKPRARDAKSQEEMRRAWQSWEE